MFIPDDKISEIRNAGDIVEVISEVVMLKKAGRNFVGLCPFHSEKTPSFTVNPEKQIFYCFGCGAGGDVFTFLKQHDNISFPEALKILASRYGIEILTSTLTPEQKRQSDERESLIVVNKEAMAYFQSALYSDIGQKAREYLQRRNISKEIIEQFHIGYAPEGWDNLTRYLTTPPPTPPRSGEGSNSRGVGLKSGLIVPRSDGKTGFYDRFRNRIMFPIFDVRMQVIGFGGRVMDDSLPKYLNSPETLLYNKSRSLYGLHLGKSECREKNHAYIVEGYIDLLSLYQHGIRNAVATLGTALSISHLRLLKGYAKKITLVYDSDAAGIKAAQRSIEIFRQEQVEAKILILPSGHDPDSFLSEFGTDAFAEYARNAQSITDFLTDCAIRKHGLSTEGKISIISEMSGYLASLDDSVARSLHIQSLAERISVDENLILEKVRSEKVRSEKSVSASHSSLMTSHLKENRLEQEIIAMMLQFPDIVPDIRHNRILESFEDVRLKRIGEMILNHPNQEVNDIIRCIENHEERSLAASLAVRDENRDLKGCLKLIDQFRFRRNSRNRNIWLQKTKKAESEKDKKRVSELIEEKRIQVKENIRAFK